MINALNCCGVWSTTPTNAHHAISTYIDIVVLLSWVLSVQLGLNQENTRYCWHGNQAVRILYRPLLYTNVVVVLVPTAMVLNVVDEPDIGHEDNEQVIIITILSVII